MVDLNTTRSIIRLNINGLNTPLKRMRLSEWIKRAGPNRRPYKTHFELRTLR